MKHHGFLQEQGGILLAEGTKHHADEWRRVGGMIGVSCMCVFVCVFVCLCVCLCVCVCERGMTNENKKTRKGRMNYALLFLQPAKIDKELHIPSQDLCNMGKVVCVLNERKRRRRLSPHSFQDRGSRSRPSNAPSVPAVIRGVRGGGAWQGDY